MSSRFPLASTIYSTVILTSLIGCGALHDSPAVTSIPSPAISQQEMQRVWTESSTPNTNHQMLSPLVGSWETSTRFWSGSDSKPETVLGRAETQWILDGRFIKEEFRGQMNGRPFEGLGITGYDNVRKKYLSVWTDTMTTGFMQSLGDFNAAKREFLFRGEYLDPLTQKAKETMMVSTVISPDKHLFEMYDHDGAGREFKCLEITYTRRK